MQKLHRLFLPFVFLLILGIGSVLSPAIGVTWDEPDNILAGGMHWKYVTDGFDQAVFTHDIPKMSSIFKGKIYTFEPDIILLPPFPNLVGTAVTVSLERIGVEMTGERIIIAFHLTTALFFGLLIVYVYRWAMLLGLSPEVALFAALSTYLYPTLFGHGYSNIKDTAQVSLFTVSLYHGVRFGLRLAWSELFVGAIVWGLAMATKFNAVYVPIIWGLWMLTQMRSIQAKRRQNPFLLLGGASLLFAVLGLSVTCMVWPFLWFDTVEHVKAVIQYYLTVGQGYRIYWDGQTYTVGEGVSYWWYPMQAFLLVTPLILLLATALGTAILIIRIKPTMRHIKSFIPIEPRLVPLLFIWIIVPLVRIFLPTSAYYDGIRHFLEVVPALVLVASLGVAAVTGLISKVLSRQSQAVRHGILGCVLFAVPAYMAWINIAYFPYSTGYFNMFAHNANTMYERDSTGLSVKEGVDYLHQTYGTVMLWAPIAGHMSWYYVKPDDVYVYNTKEADSIILINKSSHIKRWEFEKMLADTGFELDHTIRRGDAEFGWVYRKR